MNTVTLSISAKQAAAIFGIDCNPSEPGFWVSGPKESIKDFNNFQAALRAFVAVRNFDAQLASRLDQGTKSEGQLNVKISECRIYENEFITELFEKKQTFGEAITKLWEKQNLNDNSNAKK